MDQWASSTTRTHAASRSALSRTPEYSLAAIMRTGRVTPTLLDRRSVVESPPVRATAPIRRD